VLLTTHSVPAGPDPQPKIGQGQRDRAWADI